MLAEQLHASSQPHEGGDPTFLSRSPLAGQLSESAECGGSHHHLAIRAMTYTAPSAAESSRALQVAAPSVVLSKMHQTVRAAAPSRRRSARVRMNSAEYLE